VNANLRRLIGAIAFFLTLVLIGSGGYYSLGHGRWRFGDCVYMTIITISTVGFYELKDLAGVPGARALTVGLIVSGVGALTYMQSNVTALLVEGAIGQAFRRNRMRKAILALKKHVVVAGAGSTGKHVIEELITTQTPFVVIDRSLEHLDRMSRDLMDGKMLFVHGDATEDHVLAEAGIENARGIVAALTHDKDNLYVTLSARSLNPTARIVSKVVEEEAAAKVLKAGATSVVSPTAIGGRRMASEVIRPEVNEFLDAMLRDKNKNLRLEEVVVPQGSPFIGMALKDTPIRRETRLLVVAVRGKDRQFVYNPDPDLAIEAGTTLIVMGETESVVKLRSMVGVEVRDSIVV
jgi:voltage-gated potassium channel